MKAEFSPISTIPTNRFVRCSKTSIISPSFLFFLNFENIDILGSLEYSCKVAGSKLVLVLGHESCGAVKAACDGVELGNITAMLDNIMPAVRKSADEVEGEANSSNKAFVAKTVENNVRLTIERIREKSQILTEMEDNGEIQIVGGVYSLHTGKVEML